MKNTTIALAAAAALGGFLLLQRLQARANGTNSTTGLGSVRNDAASPRLPGLPVRLPGLGAGFGASGAVPNMPAMPTMPTMPPLLMSAQVM